MTPSERDDLTNRLMALRAEIRPHGPIQAEFFWGIIDAILQVVNPPAPTEEPWDDPEERAAIQGEPPTIYYRLRNPTV